MTAICAAAMVGCTNNDETPEQQELNFSPLSYKSTRAIISGTTYGTDDPTFGVFAYHSAATTNDWNTNGASAPLYIDNATISYNSDGKIWKSATTAYWPLSGSLTFIAYSPKTVNATCATATKVLTVTDFEVAKTDYIATGNHANTQADLLYSLPSAATGLTANTTTYTGVTGGAQGVGIVFRHALSQVLVNVKVAGTYANTEFKVISIKLTGMGDKATFTLTPTFGETEAAYAEAAAWGATSTSIEQVVFPIGTSTDPSEVLNTTGAQIGTNILVMPQTLVASTIENPRQQLEIEYQMTKTDVDPVVTTSTTKTVDLYTSTFTKFEINKKVTLNVSLSATEIQYAPSVTEWDPQQSPVY